MLADNVAGNIWQALPELVAVHLRLPRRRILAPLVVRLMAGPGRRCTPRHSMTYNSRSEGSKCVSMTWRPITARPCLLEKLLPRDGEEERKEQNEADDRHK